MRGEQHVSHVYVPVGVAGLLREYPTLVAPAVNAFVERDRMDSKVSKQGGITFIASCSL